MSKDVRFLRQNNLMDYSLLLGIEKNSSEQRKTNKLCNDISASEAKNTISSCHRNSADSREWSLGKLMSKRHQF